MDGIKVGYARVSTAEQDLTAQRDDLVRLGVAEELILVDHGLTGTNRARPGLREALASVRAGDTFVVTELDRLARSLRDARDIADELTAKGSCSAWAAASTTRMTRSESCCSTSSAWSPNSKQT